MELELARECQPPPHTVYRPRFYFDAGRNAAEMISHLCGDLLLCRFISLQSSFRSLPKRIARDFWKESYYGPNIWNYLLAFVLGIARVLENFVREIRLTTIILQYFTRLACE